MLSTFGTNSVQKPMRPICLRLSPVAVPVSFNAYLRRPWLTTVWKSVIVASHLPFQSRCSHVVLVIVEFIVSGFTPVQKNRRAVAGLRHTEIHSTTVHRPFSHFCATVNTASTTARIIIVLSLTAKIQILTRRRFQDTRA